jgi:hypothetical protein
MSEKIYAWLLRLYPSHFRKAYGQEALQLFRDRSRDETGFLPRLRLWCDLLADMAVSIPREYRRQEPALAVAAVQPHVDGIPEFRSLESGESPRPGALFSGACLSLLGFAAISLLMVHGHSYRPLFLRGGHAQPTPGARSSGSGHPSELPPGKGNEKVMVPSGPGKDVSSLESPSAPPANIAAKRAILQSVGIPVQKQLAIVGQPKPQDATGAMLQAFDSHDIVMLGENHGVKQAYEWLDKLVATPAFDDHVDDIVVEFGNSLYQKSVDRYIAGEDVPLTQVEKAWRNMIGSVGPVSPVYAQFYKAVRDANLRRGGKHQLRIVLGDPYGDWDKIKTAEDLGPYLAHREEWYAQVVEDEVLAKHHRALLIMGAGHFLRRNGPSLVEREIREAGANPYLVTFGTNAVDGFDNLDQRFNQWPRPAIVPLAGNWVGELSASSVTTGGVAPATPLKLANAADALLYVAPRDSLTQLSMTRAQLDGTAYEKEINRRMMIQTGHGINSLPEQAESPMFQRPQMQANAGALHGPPPMPRSARDPLPARPPSQ